MDGFDLVISINRGNKRCSGCTCSCCRCRSGMSLQQKQNKTGQNHESLSNSRAPGLLARSLADPSHFSICPELASLPHPFAAAHLQRRVGQCRSRRSVGVKCRPCCLVEVRWPWSLPTSQQKQHRSKDWNF